VKQRLAEQRVIAQEGTTHAAAIVSRTRCVAAIEQLAAVPRAFYPPEHRPSAEYLRTVAAWTREEYLLFRTAGPQLTWRGFGALLAAPKFYPVDLGAPAERTRARALLDHEVPPLKTLWQTTNFALQVAYDARDHPDAWVVPLAWRYPQVIAICMRLILSEFSMYPPTPPVRPVPWEASWRLIGFLLEWPLRRATVPEPAPAPRARSATGWHLR
jgi:hypothetical protein